jgi:uncharacterized protein
MGSPVVHFEVMGADGEKLRSFYGEMFDWEFENPPIGAGVGDYKTVDREKNLGENGEGIGGGIGTAPEGYSGHITFYVQAPDIEAALAKAEELGGERMMGPDKVSDALELGLFKDPEGNTVGVVNPG